MPVGLGVKLSQTSPLAVVGRNKVLSRELSD